jgi:hypothetical protein
MKKRNAPPDHREWQNVPRCGTIVACDPNKAQRHNRIHANALIPTQEKKRTTKIDNGKK